MDVGRQTYATLRLFLSQSQLSLDLVNPMDQEGDPCALKKAPLEPKAPTADDPDSVSSFDSDPSLSEGELLTTLSPLLSDEEIVESVYQSLLLIILSLQLQQGSAEVWCFDCCKTPPPSRVAETVPDTCPGAPMKLAKISRTIDSGGLRRKLF
ncbi:Cyclin-dependent protein kinase inhibitor SMR11 [Hirschfeldia incana]|nr:Cyclin-dependent protein kinase inhibitor SMR11 [Hirschfeldia incana]